ncbi:MAG: hypothetical protein K6A42_09275 [Treponema sp.]|nr:hypothetical protein [Treponema sp.]
MRKKIFTCLFFFVVLIIAASCSIGSEASEPSSLLGIKSGGSITMTLPQSPAAQGLASASIASEGSLENEAVSTFKIYVRNSALKKELVQESKPGSTITIDELEPGTWSVSIRGLDSEGELLFYGKSEDITVEAGQTAAAAIGLNKFASEYLSLSLEEYDCQKSDVYYAYITCAATNSSQKYEAFYYIGQDGVFSQPEDEKILYAPLKEFFEPGEKVVFNVRLFGLYHEISDLCLWNAKIEKEIPAKGGAISLELSATQEKFKCERPSEPSTIFIDDDIPQKIKDEYLFYKIQNDDQVNVDPSNVIVTPLHTGSCGEIPVLIECDDMIAFLPLIVCHKVAAPAVSVQDQNIPIGVTRTIVPSITYKEWPVYGWKDSEEQGLYDEYGFALYGLNGRMDKDTSSEPTLTVVTEPGSNDIGVIKDGATALKGNMACSNKCVLSLKGIAGGFYSSQEESELVETAFNASGVSWTYNKIESVIQEQDCVFIFTNESATQADWQTLKDTEPSITLYNSDNGTPYESSFTVEDSKITVNLNTNAWTGGTTYKVSANMNERTIGSWQIQCVE